MPMPLAKLASRVALLFASWPVSVSTPPKTVPRQPRTIPTAPTQPSYRIPSLPTLEGKKQVYAVSESPNGLLVNLNIRGTHSWDFTAFPKSREAYKKILGHIPAGYQQWFKTAQLALESDIASTGQLAKYPSYVFYGQNSTSIETRGLASVQHVPLLGTKEVIGVYASPYDQWILFPLAVGKSWTDSRTVSMKLRDPNGSKLASASSRCSVHSEREVVDEGHILLDFAPNRQIVPCLVTHERVEVSCSTGSKIEHTYYWINADFGFVAYVSGLENRDAPIFDRASGIASLLKTEDMPPAGQVNAKEHVQSPKN